MRGEESEPTRLTTTSHSPPHDDVHQCCHATTARGPMGTDGTAWRWATSAHTQLGERSAVQCRAVRWMVRRLRVARTSRGGWWCCGAGFLPRCLSPSAAVLDEGQPPAICRLIRRISHGSSDHRTVALALPRTNTATAHSSGANCSADRDREPATLQRLTAPSSTLARLVCHTHRSLSSRICAGGCQRQACGALQAVTPLALSSSCRVLPLSPSSPLQPPLLFPDVSAQAQVP